MEEQSPSLPDPLTEPEIDSEKIEELIVEEPPVSDEFQVTEEIYERTFQDIETLISELNTIIQNMEYNTWVSYLSEPYIKHYSDNNVLKEISDQPLLKKYNLKLKSMADYFQYVVAPSRANARLDDIVFEDEDHVKAIMVIDGQRSILYQLVYIDGRWKIGL